MPPCVGYIHLLLSLMRGSTSLGEDSLAIFFVAFTKITLTGSDEEAPSPKFVTKQLFCGLSVSKVDGIMNQVYLVRRQLLHSAQIIVVADKQKDLFDQPFPEAAPVDDDEVDRKLGVSPSSEA
ncbi:unnamed protein product [Schistocephalus solidus]|uniref:Sm domain-containing protein n=1 Tax=Schistocephalus solidus TaxID=70667 RepID=A0A183SEZ1_SCHSO|nr:unnamed protein product [Schistocephalus solidus]